MPGRGHLVPDTDVKRLWQAILGYIWWTHPRGSMHYDVMVTLILLFIFLSPYFIDFNDKPVERVPHQTGLVVIPDGTGFIYQIDAAAVRRPAESGPACGPQRGAELQQQLLHVIEPVAGEVEIGQVEGVCDQQQRLQSYRVRVQRHLLP